MNVPETLLAEQVDRGTILLSNIFDDIDHSKFFVIIGVSETHVAGFFFINSNINRYIMGKPEQLAMQYQMRKADYPFLKYDSFLSATAIRKIPKTKLAETISDGRTKFVGVMKEQHIDEILEAARNSILFSKAEKRQFLQ